MTDTNKVMSLQHFVSNLADTQIWIRINSENWIWFLDHLRLRFWLWRRLALSEHSPVIIIIIVIIILAAVVVVTGMVLMLMRSTLTPSLSSAASSSPTLQQARLNTLQTYRVTRNAGSVTISGPTLTSVIQKLSKKIICRQFILITLQ